MTLEFLHWWVGLGVILAPAVLVATIGLPLLIGFPLPEKFVSRVTFWSVLSGMICAISTLVLMLMHDERQVVISMEDWVTLPIDHFHLHISFVFDRLSVPFAILSTVLVGTISAFASRYLHRELGFNRFFLLNAVFLLGMVVASTAQTIETLFIGWELVGLSSALLVGFFHERTSPVINGQRVWSVYRVADAAFLIAAVVLHSMQAKGQYEGLISKAHWPEGTSTLMADQALIVGLLLLVAVAGKSALIPFSGWLPRAMEGPTPSSAVFYGAMSVHLGAFLLLRTSPLLDASPLLSGIVVVLGLATAVFALLTGRVQSDVKSALAFASLMQVGIITAEIGCGLRYIPLIHIIGHAFLRTLQLVRAPSLLQDYHMLENDIGTHLSNQQGWLDRWVPERMKIGLYRLSMERGYLDASIDEYVVWPFLAVFGLCDRLERRWTDFLSRLGTSPRPEGSATLPVEERA